MRETVFISKATPEDDEFVLWIAPKLEASGFRVFADILALEPGDRWRKEVTNTLQNSAIKMLLCCTDATLAKNGVQEEIGIAEDLVKELRDSRFIIPLRLKPFKKLFGIGELQYIDFVGSWARGLSDLLSALEKQNVPKELGTVKIDPHWEAYKKRQSIRIEESPEVLTSNWVRIAQLPDFVRYYQPPGAIDHGQLTQACRGSVVPCELYLRGFFSFAQPDEIDEIFRNVGSFEVASEHDLFELLEQGSSSPDVRPREIKNLIMSMFRRAWEAHCRNKELFEYAFSNQIGFHVTKTQIGVGKRIPWGQPDERRSAMLRNIAKGKVWQYGVTASPSLWPFPHFKLKSRVLFSELSNKEAANVIDDPNQQHRLRRTICSVWRNKAWHGRLMAFLELLSGDSKDIDLPLSRDSFIRIESSPMQATSPFTTALPNLMDEDAEETDTSTLGNLFLEDDD